MTASTCNPLWFLNKRISFLLLALILTMTWDFSVTGNTQTPLIQLRGEAGGNVTIHCPFEEHRTIISFYFQKTTNTKEEVFVNGYHVSRNMSEVQTWENTQVDYGVTTVYMLNLNISHSGDYRCLIRYQSGIGFVETKVHLSVTANYSKPKVTTTCDVLFCQVTCASHGGYPQTKITWSESENPMLRVENSSEMRDPVTMMFNSSSTAYFNCSKGEMKHLSCSVGDVTSDLFSVCTRKDPPDHTVTIVAICAVVLSLIIMALMLSLWKCKKGPPAREVIQEWGPDESEGEAVGLNATRNEGEQAS